MTKAMPVLVFAVGDSGEMKWVALFAILSVMPVVDGAKVPPKPLPEARVIEETAAPVKEEQTLAALPLPPALSGDDSPHEICRIGLIVMIPDGREGRVTSREDGICRVLAYGEGYVSLWPEDLVEPVYPQELPQHVFGH
jgi:hypothetical protein